MDELSRLERCAKGGEAYSQYNLGARYMNGLAAPQDLNKAFYWTEKAAKQGYPLAESNLGWLYYKGWGVRKDDKKAFEWTEKSVRQGHIPAYINLGFFYSHGIGIPVDWKKGAEYYQLATNAGIAEAYQNLGIAYQYGKGVPQNTQKALELTKKAVNEGSQLAIYNLGGIYSSMGKNEEAVLWLRKAAELNIVSAQADLAGKLAETAKSEIEKQEARQWLEKALMQNDPYAYAMAGVLYSEKNNVFPVDEAKAYEYYMKAAEMEEEKSQASLAWWFWEGRYVVKDERKAVEWFERSANNGEIKAAKKLVEIYGNGTKDIPKNEAKKQYWKNKLVVE
ncbi:tetratricopeptide repeat protein [Neisseria dumasiana]|uniref:tetratricopeptide repeat protein n=1 Tax=Neisseria dumasiana TaxID=1931275 RepID=UPI0015548CE7|nr:SEL1-like repeat protein [Neisseria dumasiana]